MVEGGRGVGGCRRLISMVAMWVAVLRLRDKVRRQRGQGKDSVV